MGKRTCSIDGCDKPWDKRIWCGMHYRRWQRHGDPLGGGLPRFRDPEETFRARVRPDGECLLWIGALNQEGYGRLRIDGVLVRAHRYAWARAHGPVPDGLYVDHVCHNRACVNAAHLRLATHSQNEANRSGAPSSSSTGFRNVMPENSSYRVVVQRGDYRYSELFVTVEDAVVAAEVARQRIFGDFSGRG